MYKLVAIAYVCVSIQLPTAHKTETIVTKPGIMMVSSWEGLYSFSRSQVMYKYSFRVHNTGRTDQDQT